MEVTVGLEPRVGGSGDGAQLSPGSVVAAVDDSVVSADGAADSASSGVGGLGFTSVEIGYVFAISGVSLFVFTICAVPYLARKFGNLLGLRLGLCLVLPLHLFFPIIAPLQQRLPSWLFWTVLGGSVSYRQCCLTMSFTTVMVAVNNSVPPSRLGEVNGLGQAFAALARGIAPWLGGALWSACLSFRSYFAIYLVYGAIAAANGASIALACSLPEELERSPGLLA